MSVYYDPMRSLPVIKKSITRYVRNVSMRTLQATIEHAMLQFYIVAVKSEYNIEHAFSSLNE